MATPRTIRARYGELARSGVGCCGSEATFSLGSGDVVRAAELRAGERVLDLGSGAGHDALRAADLVGPTGRVDGVDFTPAMLARARSAAAGRENVAFHEADIQHLPFRDASFDVVMTNCVVNLVPDKRRTFAEARRVLQPGGRLVVSDIVFTREPDPAVRADDVLACACVGGAALLADYLTWLRELGLGDVRIVDGHPYGAFGGADALAMTFVAREGTAEGCC